jgi:Leucine-rich repeat (LRR) protein
MLRRLAVVTLLLLACRTPAPPPLPAPAELEVMQLGTLRHLGRWDGTPQAPGTYLTPVDPQVAPALLVRTLQGKGVRALSLSGVVWAGTSKLAVLSVLPLEWLDLSAVSLEPGALRTLQVPRVVLDESNVTDALLQELPGPMRELQLRETRVTDESVPWLLRQTRLDALGLDSTRLTAAGVGALRGLPLRQLDLAHTALNDDSLQLLEGLSTLEALSLEGTQTTNAGLRHLRGLEALTSLNLSSTDITDEGLVGLEHATGLTDVRLAHTLITDRTVTRLANLVHLRTLDLGRTAITEAATKTLARLTGLEVLSLAETPQTSAGIARLSGLTGLRDLDLEKTAIDGAVLGTLGRFTHLESLDLGSTDLFEAHLERLPHGLRALRLEDSRAPVSALAPLLPGLEVLDLSHLEFGDSDAQAFVGHAPALRLLKVNYTAVRDAGAQALAQLPSLERLDAGKTEVTTRGVAALASSTTLRALDLGLCAIDDGAVLALEHTALESLHLAGTKVTDVGVAHLPRSLRVVGLVDTRLTQHAVQLLLALPLLRQVDLRQVKVDVTPLRRRGVALLE